MTTPAVQEPPVPAPSATVPPAPVVDPGPITPAPAAVTVGSGTTSAPLPTSPVIPATSDPSAAPTSPPAPYDLPADFQAPMAPSVPTGPLGDIERQQLDYYRRREQENALQDQVRFLDEYEQKSFRYYVDREAQDETTARLLATVHRTERQAALQREIELRGTFQAQQRVSQAATQVAKEFNVNPRLLAGFQRPEDMARHAAVIRAFGDYRNTTEKRLAALEKARVPDQTFLSGGGQAADAGGSYAERLKSGKPLPTAAEIDRMTAGYLQR